MASARRHGAHGVAGLLRDGIDEALGGRLLRPVGRPFGGAGAGAWLAFGTRTTPALSSYWAWSLGLPWRAHQG
jgi:hypothetical protein